ncbi:class I SAM-dependent methyltransferase [Nocardiopsis algeriensis]|uniref:SAM-dependent methyltransferase n=1 Tax=Nocardiopsis algeriensis TaxID=1478215 RepID=A0A841IJ54_9ACTN|nr:methyltransferase domain-containing protein [Nocardiopsis algeriensis]MBB6118703.1 SAM-dependent methyltransferase [Nocardiopsis algeriensis]
MDSQAEQDRRFRIRGALRRDRGEILEGIALRHTREILCAGARGRTLEVAVGSGPNLRHYPPQIRLTALDADAEALALARERAEELGLPARFLEGDVQALDLPDESFETVMCTFALDAIPDQERALREMYRVLAPGGRLLMADRIEYARFPGRLLERRRERPRRLPRDVAVDAGFRVGHHDRLFFGLVERVVAHRPA